METSFSGTVLVILKRGRFMAKVLLHQRTYYNSPHFIIHMEAWRRAPAEQLNYIIDIFIKIKKAHL